MGGGTRYRDMTLRALLAPDCGEGVGLGHLERMLALADALQPHVSVSLILPEGDAVLRRRVEDRGHTAVAVPGETATRVQAAVGSTRSVDLVVLDGYVFDVEMQTRLRERAPLTVVDDLGLPADCDLAVNPSPGGERLRPTGATTFLGGAAYALLRAAFAEARETVLRHGRSSRTVLVSTGATDLDGIGGRVGAELLETDPSVEVTRVVGPDARVRARDRTAASASARRTRRPGRSSRQGNGVRRRRRHDRCSGGVRRNPGRDQRRRGESVCPGGSTGGCGVRRGRRF